VGRGEWKCINSLKSHNVKGKINLVLQNAELKSEAETLDRSLSSETERVGNISKKAESAKDYANGKLVAKRN
jgi:hypothetical protein